MSGSRPLGSDRFEQQGVWGHLAEAPDIALKTRMFLEMIPDGVSTVLDVGCGDGAITNRLANSYDVTAVDLSDAALEHVQAKKLRANAASLPFPDRSFDLVLSSQMLEHFDRATYASALRELRRVSDRYLLLSVPYREDLKLRRIRCPRCGWQGHVWGHRRAFTVASLMGDLVGLEPRDIRLFGDLEQPPWPRWALWTFHNLLHSFYWPTGQSPMCERCGNTDWSGARGFPPHADQLKGWLDRRSRHPKLPFWIAVLAERPIA